MIERKIEPMTIEERDRIMNSLTLEQRDFIHHQLVRGRRTLFARQLAESKCQFIPEDAELEEIEQFIEEWDYIGFTDSGTVSPHTKCECGRSLRYQHKVLHVPTNTFRYFGIDHLQLHTGIDAKIVSAIMRGFDVLDSEMHELLRKHDEGWKLEYYVYMPLPEELKVPADIQRHIDAGLPLLDRQLQRLRARLRELERSARLEQASARAKAALENRYPSAIDAEPSEDAWDDSGYADGMEWGQEPPPQELFEEGQASFFFDDLDEDPPPPQDQPAAAAYAAHQADYSPAQSGSALDPFHLPQAAKTVVDEAWPLGRVSCAALSEFILERQLASDRRFSTGKPHIYIAVAAYLDRLMRDGHVRLVEASSEDRIYAKRN